MTCRHREWLDSPPTTLDEWANFDAEVREHRADGATLSEKRLIYMVDLVAGLRVFDPDRLRGHPNEAYCEWCECRKTGWRIEPNARDENCDDSGCFCHVVYVACDFCDHVGPESGGRWLVESGPPGTQTIWACERCANDQENVADDERYPT